MKIPKCEGCQWEAMECYEWQSRGYDAGLEFYKNHCSVFVLDKNGEFIIK